MTIAYRGSAERRAYCAAYRATHREEARALSIAWRAAHPAEYLDHSRRRNAHVGGFLPPPLEKNCPSRPADGKCWACGKVAKLQMDHCHDTGAFRGWLCRSCNRKDAIAELHALVVSVESLLGGVRTGRFRFANVKSFSRP